MSLASQGDARVFNLPVCRSSKGELACISYFNTMNITIQRQFELPSFRNRYYDFMFRINDRWYLLEFDGIQHFKFVSMFHKNKAEFVHNQQIDILKTQNGIEAGYFVIRIDYKQIDTIASHVQEALKYPEYRKYYVSNYKTYHHLVSQMNTYFIRRLLI